MSELVDWLRAQLAADERDALCATFCDPEDSASGDFTEWHVDAPNPRWPVAVNVANGTAIVAAGYNGAYEHIARWDPARVLAEVAAKRRIIEHVSSWQHDDPDGGGYYSCPLVPGSSRAEDEDWDGTSCWCGVVARQMAILGPLALPYAGRDGWREEWRPE